MAFLERFKAVFKKVVNKVRKYADGGNVASGPNYGFSQQNPIMARNIGSAYPNVPPAPQGLYGVTNPPAFAQNNGAPGVMANNPAPFKKGGKVKSKVKKKTKTSSSKRADGIAQRGKTRGKMV